MDSTTHTTTTVEFVDWRAKAKAKLEAEDKLFKGSRAAKSVQSYVLRTLLGFVDQEPRFAEVVCNTQRTFSECCAAVVNNAGEVLSDLETYRRAVQFYFPKPQPLLQRIPSDVQKSRLWEHCTVCGKYQPMKEMYALLLRRKRGDNPERVAYMCPECYVKFSMKHFEKGEKEDEV